MITQPKVSAGDPLRIHHRTFNAMLDLIKVDTDAAAGRRRSRQPAGVPLFGFASADLDEFQVVDVSDLEIDPESTGYDADVQLSAPSWPTSLGRYGILAQPAASGDSAIAIVGGAALATVNVVSTSDRFATIDPDTPAQLKSADTGDLSLVPPSGTGVRTCVVIFDRGPTLWRYKLLEAFGASTANQADAILRTLGGDDFADSVPIRDPLVLMDDQVTDDEGFCHQVGDRFYAIQAPC